MKENLKLQTHQSILNTIKELREDKNNYTSFYDAEPMLGIDDAELKDQIIEHAGRLLNDSHVKRNFKNYHAWWSIYDYGNHHCWHTHPRAVLSGSYYLNVPKDSAPIEFKSALEPLIKVWDENSFTGSRWSQSYEIYPEPGDLLIWPSFVEHQVPEIKGSPGERCVISFNLI